MENADFTQIVDNTKRPLVVYFSATWCMPCKMMAPALENVRYDYRERIEFIKLDADAHPKILKELKIYGVPTLIGYNQGVEIIRRTGAQSEKQLKNLFESIIQNRAVQPGIAPIDRYLRLGTGLAILLYGWFSAGSLLLTFVGGVIAFSAVYDRCPIFKAVTTKAAELWKKFRA